LLIIEALKAAMIYKFLVPLLLAASGAYTIGDWCLSGCLSVCPQFFFKSLLLQFSLILTQLDKHDVRANMQKLWNRFSKFCF